MTMRLPAPSVRRPLGTVLAVLALVPTIASCTKAVRSDVAPAYVQETSDVEEKVIAAVTTDGRELVFDDPGAQVRRDTLTARVGGELLVLPISEIDRVEIERRQTNAVATVALVLGVVLGAMVVASAIALATKESCPFVYSWNGEAYVFDAEPYGGAITRGLERDDYSLLDHLRPDDGQYRLRITNEVNETQRTDFMELWVVDHEPGARIAADAAGNLHDVSARQAPLAARDAVGRDLLRWLVDTDRLVWEPMAVVDVDGRLQQEIELTFPHRPGASEARLVVNASTGLWGSHMIREFVQLRGPEGAAAWFAGLDTDPEALSELHAWNVREQLYVLRVYVEEPTGWELRGTLMGEGPFVAHDRVLPLDVSRVRGESLKVRIEPPRGFWALNSFGIDYGETPTLTPTRVPPTRARAFDGADVLPLLAAVDGAYYSMPTTDDRAEVTFDAPPPVPGRERSVILHTRGYYDLHLDPTAPTDRARIDQIEAEPGAGLRYAAELYERWTPEELLRRAGWRAGADD
jgi:hypothetical protein